MSPKESNGKWEVSSISDGLCMWAHPENEWIFSLFGALVSSLFVLSLS